MTMMELRKEIHCTLALCFKAKNVDEGKIDSKVNLEIWAKNTKMKSDKKFPPAS